jgi:hypothetical protein
MKIITIAFLESKDYKDSAKNVRMKDIESSHLNCDIPDNVEFVFTSGDSKDKRELIDNLNGDLNKYGYFTELKLKKL